MRDERAVDFKISKLETGGWSRNPETLAAQLYRNQGSARHHDGLRILLVFDRSENCGIEFRSKNRELILGLLLGVVNDPQANFYETPDGHCCWLVLVSEDRYEKVAGFYEHSIGAGLRDEEIAAFDNELSKELETRSNGKWRHNPNEKQRGIDGFLDLS